MLLLICRRYHFNSTFYQIQRSPQQYSFQKATSTSPSISLKESESPPFRRFQWLPPFLGITLDLIKEFPILIITAVILKSDCPSESPEEWLFKNQINNFTLTGSQHTCCFYYGQFFCLSVLHISPYLLSTIFPGNNRICIFLYFSVHKILCRYTYTVFFLFGDNTDFCLLTQ